MSSSDDSDSDSDDSSLSYSDSDSSSDDDEETSGITGEQESQYNDIDGLVPADSEMGEIGTCVFQDGADGGSDRRLYGGVDLGSDSVHSYGGGIRGAIMALQEPAESHHEDDLSTSPPAIGATCEDGTVTTQKLGLRSTTEEIAEQKIQFLERRVKRDMSLYHQPLVQVQHMNLNYGTITRQNNQEPQEELIWCFECCCACVPARVSPSPRYTSLPGPSFIRVFILHPGGGDSTLSGSLEALNLNDAKSHYEAISYRWGPPKPRKAMLLSGRMVYISRSLHSMLLDLRHRHRDRILWADALCINQADYSERKQQVSMMQRIYTRASRVIIYLKGENDHVQDCFSVVQDLTSAWLTFQKSEVAIYNGHVSPESIYDGVISSFKMGRIAEIFKNCYWTRLWMVQEVVSARTAVVQWNGQLLSWTLLGLATTLIRNNASLWKMFTSAMLSRRAKTGFMNAYLMYRLPSAGFRTDSLSFLDLLRLTRNFDVTMPLDRVYATLGIPSQQTGPGRKFVTPDYRLLLEGLYTRVFHWVTTTHEIPLEILSAVRHTDKSIPNFPTWIPQWHVEPIRSIGSSHRKGMKFDASAGWSGKPLLEVSWRLDGRSLTLEGFVLGTIIASKPVLPPILSKAARVPANYTSDHRQALATWTAQHFPDNKYVRSRLSLTLTAGQDWYGAILRQQDALSKHQASFESWIQQYSPSQGNQIAAGDVKQYDQAVESVCRGRKLFAATGCQMGLGPECLASGDVVCVILGGPVPYVLRPCRGGRYQFVGECYVPGYMAGEAVAEWTTPSSTALNPRRFVLL
ncbi:uncharacterized protein E0L32_006321 [Thyridium curvatum]|uniref:Heterokaryon incompatibility domain-containing protein n=1 Tax=Thyridium curvatum TaxID=1093900 RepID=A0A507B990_9PEZI|nr:uncharacterized protein E0L32_006321 [Thyridium curvatum]TPX13348.1 hypothetical protein E0L32_006321 [Thyridium curvatum]